MRCRRTQREASACRVPHLPFQQHLPAAHGSSNGILQLCRAALPKTQPARSRNCLGRSPPLATHRDGATGRGDLAGGSALLGFKLSVCKQLSPCSCWVQLDESGRSRGEGVKADKSQLCNPARCSFHLPSLRPVCLQKYLSNPSFV